MRSATIPTPFDGSEDYVFAYQLMAGVGYPLSDAMVPAIGGGGWSTSSMAPVGMLFCYIAKRHSSALQPGVTQRFDR